MLRIGGVFNQLQNDADIIDAARDEALECLYAIRALVDAAQGKCEARKALAQFVASTPRHYYSLECDLTNLYPLQAPGRFGNLLFPAASAHQAVATVHSAILGKLVESVILANLYSIEPDPKDETFVFTLDSMLKTWCRTREWIRANAGRLKSYRRDLLVPIHREHAELVRRRAAGQCITQANAQATPDIPKTYTISEALNMAHVSDDTLRKYARKAGVPTPGPGKRNHRYTAAELRKIFQCIIDHSSDNRVKDECRKAMETLAKPKISPAETRSPDRNTKC